eukprot:13304473-Heterocapsa_arctica.AAC.1
MVIARALPASPAPTNIMMFYIFGDPLDRSGSTFRCASDDDSESSPRWPCNPQNLQQRIR